MLYISFTESIYWDFPLHKFFMKKYFSIICLLILFHSSFGQTVVPEGPVSGLWTSVGSPYLVEGNIVIPTDSSLSIEPGVEVIFKGHFNIKIYGALHANGTREDSISFSVQDTSGFSDPMNYQCGWGGIRFTERIGVTDTSTLRFCQIEYTVLDTAMNLYYQDYGAIYNSYNYSGTVLIENCWIRNNRMCVHSSFGETIIRNCIISYNTGGGIRMLYNTAAPVYGNIVSGNTPGETGGGGMSFAGHPVIINNTVCFNTALRGGGLSISDDGGTLRVYNSILFGNIATASPGSMAYSDWSWINFYNCVLEGIYFAEPGPDTVSVNTTAYEDLFEDTGSPIYTLSGNSVAIDSGMMEIYISSVLFEHPEYDVLGNPRIQNNRIDVGAIETEPSFFICGNTIEIDGLKVFPNPAQSDVKLVLDPYPKSPLFVTMIDMGGKKVYEKEMSNSQLNIDISNLPKGLYILKVSSEKGDRSQLIIKQ